MNEMNCALCQHWLHGYIDNELDATTATRIADHMAKCPECMRRYREMKTLSHSVKEHGMHHAAPAALTRSIFATIEAEATPVRESWLGNLSKSWFAPAFSMAAIAATLLLYVVAPSGQDQWADETISDHVRSLMDRHLTDVQSSDRHTVKPWFAGKLDFAPPVYDFAPQGYPLLGGRLDYLQHETVAALAYQHSKHIINVFIQPTKDEDSAPQSVSKRGYNIVSWRKNHMAFKAISDMNTDDLKVLGQLISDGSQVSSH